MQNKNYEFIRRSRKKGAVQILKKSESLIDLVLLKRKYRNNTRNIYEIRPEIVKLVNKNFEIPLCS
jgi:hypothetical protein